MSSKYTIETGDGYEGRYSVSSGKVSISIGMIDIDWEIGTTVAAVAHQDGVEITPDPSDRTVLSRPAVQNQGHGPEICLSGPALRSLDLEGHEVRVYQLGTNSLLIVDADDDPRVYGGDI